MSFRFGAVAASGGGPAGLPVTGLVWHFAHGSWDTATSTWINLGTAGGSLSVGSGSFSKQAAALNGYDTARMGGYTHYMTHANVSASMPSDEMTAYLVFKDPTGSSPKSQTLFRTRQQFVAFFQSGTKLYRLGVGGYSVFDSSQSLLASDTSWRVVGFRFKSGTNNARIYPEGMTATDGTSAASAPAPSETYLRIYAMEYAEIAFYAAAHSNAEMSANLTALKTKYGL